MLDLTLEGIGLLLPIAFSTGMVGEVSFQLHVDRLSVPVSVKVEISNNFFRNTGIGVGCLLIFVGKNTRQILTDFLRLIMQMSHVKILRTKTLHAD